MSGGCLPGSAADADPKMEPLCYWLPRLLAPMPPLSVAQRVQVCEQIMLRQDDAWAALVKASA